MGHVSKVKAGAHYIIQRQPCLLEGTAHNTECLNRLAVRIPDVTELAVNGRGRT
jgi:hypothetical protein